MSFSITDKCTGCEDCKSHCTGGAIKTVLDGEKKYCTIDSDLCVSCGHCALFCKEGAVVDDKGNVVKPIPEEERLIPAVDLSICTGCMLCVESCPEYALSMFKITRTLSLAALLHPDNCLGCGLCYTSCPVRAISMIKRKDLNASGKNSRRST